MTQSKGVQPPDGTTEDRRVFLILFDDYDRRPMLVTGEVMARAAFKRWSDSWNAHLFAKIASNSRDDARANDNATLAEPSMSTTSPSAYSVTDAPVGYCVKGDDDCVCISNMHLCINFRQSIEGGAKP